jgi:hypothetical protein
MMSLAGVPVVAAMSGDMRLGYETKHIYRGVDSAMDEEIVWASAQATVASGYLGLWYGTGPTSDYEEVDLYGGYTFDVGEWRVTPNFIWYHFPANSSADSTDLMVKVDRTYLSGEGLSLTPELIYSYNIDAKGHYAELALVVGYAVSEAWTFSVRPAVAASNHLRPRDGADHAEVIGRATYRVNDNLHLQGFVGLSYSMHAIETIQDDVAWGGLTIIARF